MTWIHSPKLASLLATEVSRLVCGSPAYQPEQSATWKETLIANALSPKGLTMDGSMMRHYGMMSEPLTGDPGVDTWILLLRDSRANPTPSQDSAAESLTNVISGRTPLESLGTWDPATCSWRTYQASLWTRDTLEPWSGSWLGSGTTQSGTVSRLRPSVPRTSVGGGGALPTPSVQRFHSNKGGSDSSDPRGWSRNGQERLTLDGMAKTGMWPTPRAGKTTDEEEESWRARQRDGKVSTPPLTLAVKMWSTPKGTPSGPDYARREREGSGGDDLATQVGGQLNPSWVEWLMGLPIGWTDLEPLVMESYQQWCDAFLS